MIFPLFLGDTSDYVKKKESYNEEIAILLIPYSGILI
jgi:hypothetical protein